MNPSSVPKYETIPDLPRDHSLLEAKIESYLYDYENGKKVCKYIIACRYTKHLSWEIKRRYKEFHLLAENLKRAFNSIPPLPGKTLLPLTSDTQLEKRKQALDDFLQHIVTREELFSHPTFYSFLGVSKEVPFLMTNFPVPIGSLSNTTAFGYRWAQLSLRGGFGLVASHPVYVSTRVDSYFTNMLSSRGGILSKDPEAKAVASTSADKVCGLVEFVKRKQAAESLQKSKSRQDGKELKDYNEIVDKLDSDDEVNDPLNYFKFEKAFDKAFKSQVIACEWLEKLSAYAVGLDSGDVFIFYYNTGNNQGFVKETPFYKAHSKRVMKFAYDQDKEMLHSVGEDNRMISYDLGVEKIVSRLNLPTKKATYLLLNSLISIILITDVDGSIYTINVTKKYPEVLQKIDTQLKGPLRGVYGYFERGLLFVSSYSDGIIKIYHNPDMGDYRNTFECKLAIKGPMHPRTLFFWPERQELWVGCSKGLVNIYGGLPLNEIPDLKSFSMPTILNPTCKIVFTSLFFTSFR